MLAKTLVVAISTFGILAAASPQCGGGGGPITVTVPDPPGPGPTTISQCNTGDAQCCNDVEEADSPIVSSLTGLLGIVLEDLTGLVGIGCTPITIIGVGSGANCAQQPVCCEDNNFNGVIALGCNPISL